MTLVLSEALVGRDAELRELKDAITHARLSAGRVVFVTGEAGIGKSRLTREAAAAARDNGLQVASRAPRSLLRSLLSKSTLADIVIVRRTEVLRND